MYIKVEPSGCCERKGMMQVRFCMYLEKDDYLFDVSKAFGCHDNPFHNHFVLVSPETTDKELMDIGEAFLHEAYIKWASDNKLDLVNDALLVNTKGHSKAVIEQRLQNIKSAKLERKI